jgi:hypothetical protein
LIDFTLSESGVQVSSLANRDRGAEFTVFGLKIGLDDIPVLVFTI